MRKKCQLSSFPEGMSSYDDRERIYQISINPFDFILTGMDKKINPEDNLEIVNALKLFPYFDTWNKNIISDCSRLSKIRVFPPDHVVFGSEEYEADEAHFIIEGTCKLIEQLFLIPKANSDGKKKYFPLCDRSVNRLSNACDEPRYSSLLFKTDKLKNVWVNETVDCESKENQNSSDGRREEDGVNVKSQRRFLKFYTRLIPYFPAKNKIVPEKSDNVECHFLQIALISKGCCLGLGENLRNRFLISVTKVKCLVIPYQFLLQHNPNNLWNRIKQFLNNYLPDERKIISEFITNRKWNNDKRRVFSRKNKRKCATIEDVPKSIRLIDSNMRIHSFDESFCNK